MEDQCLITSRLDKGVHWARQNIFNKKHPLVMLDYVGVQINAVLPQLNIEAYFIS